MDDARRAWLNLPRGLSSAFPADGSKLELDNKIDLDRVPSFGIVPIAAFGVLFGLAPGKVLPGAS
jgi:hypothetical protein